MPKIGMTRRRTFWNNKHGRCLIQRISKEARRVLYRVVRRAFCEITTEEHLMSKSSNSTTPALPRFDLGQLCQTPGAQAVLQRYQVNSFQLIGRHNRGDWGDVCPEDARANEEALRVGARILSSYVLAPPLYEGETLAPAKVWLITEADRSVTTILLPEEY